MRPRSQLLMFRRLRPLPPIFQKLQPLQQHSSNTPLCVLRLLLQKSWKLEPPPWFPKPQSPKLGNNPKLLVHRVICERNHRRCRRLQLRRPIPSLLYHHRPSFSYLPPQVHLESHSRVSRSDYLGNGRTCHPMRMARIWRTIRMLGQQRGPERARALKLQLCRKPTPFHFRIAPVAPAPRVQFNQLQRPVNQRAPQV